MNEIKGLGSVEAASRLARFGPNSMPVPRHRLRHLVLRQLRGIFNILLLIAAVLALTLGDPIDALIILLFIFIGTTLNIIQEYKSDKAVEKLKAYLQRTIIALRDDVEQEVPIENLVPGDVLILNPGDVVPADATIMECRNLIVDETTFTGESIPVEKIKMENLRQGVVIVKGNAIVEVTATGVNTKLAALASTNSGIHEKSNLVKSMDSISRFMLKVILITILFVILANLMIDGWKTGVPELLIFSIALAVSVIPETLPLVLTFSLSRGAMKFAKNSVIVKRLSSVQDLGSVNLLCVDKTGTITENRLVFANEWQSPSSEFQPLLLARLASLEQGQGIHEPFDLAIEKALTPEIKKEASAFIMIDEEAFDPDLRSNGAVVSRRDGLMLHIRRGSPEYFINQNLIKRDQVQEWLDSEEREGRRVLGVSYDDGKESRFGGFVSFINRLKDTTIETIKASKDLNLAITIITGDALVVAKAVGKEAGLLTDDSEIILAEDFLILPEKEQKKLIDKIRIFARTTPEQKLELIELLKENHTVGYLGEGVNDVPALRAANVSMVVQSAANVARESADIILLKNDLRVIVDGIRLGRKTHANILKYIRATLISNFGNFYAVAIGSLFIRFLPMLPKQLLLLNLLTDFPMIAIAFDRVSKRDIERPQRYDLHGLYIIFMTMGLISTVFDFIYFGLFYHISPETLHTNWFIASVITELLLVFSIRSMLPAWKAGLPSMFIVLLSGLSMAVAVGIPSITWLGKFFDFKTPTVDEFGMIFGLALLYLLITEIVKRPLARFLNRKEHIKP